MKTTLVFTGDIGFDRYMDNKWNDPEIISPEIQKFFDDADHVFPDVEGALMLPQGDGTYFRHSMNPEATAFLDRIHADVWVLANNHTMDSGRPGMENTLRLAEQHGAKTVGAGLNVAQAARPVILPEAGGIGILAVGQDANCILSDETNPGVLSWNDFDRIQKAIDEIKRTCRWCILAVHGGEEFDTIPLPYVRDRYVRYLDMGVDILVGHHPHVPQNYETFPNGKIIFYSLGNFVFDTDYQRQHPNSDVGILLKLLLDENDFSFEAICVKLDRTTDRLFKAPLPAIFTDISPEEFEKLTPLAAQVYLHRFRILKEFMKPDVFKNCEPWIWDRFYHDTTVKTYRKGEHADFEAIIRYASGEDRSAQADPAVREYLTSQLD